ncbi:C2 domain-containing protein At1g53590-like isoform X3 [Carex rostrata]
MSILDISIVHHIALVLAVIWALVSVGWSHPLVFFCALIYLYAVNERYSDRLRRRLQYEERKSANQKRKKAVLQNLYLGRNPPIFTDIRVLRHSADDDHLVLEMGMNFLTGDDMNAVLSVQLTKRLGFGITANLHVTGMHVEGKILVGVKFLRQWPFLERVRVCFVEPPYFQMTVKPIFGHGLDVAELPGISGWLDKLLDVAFRQTLVEPNMLVVDVEKFVKVPTGGWFTVDEKRPVAQVKLELMEGADMKPSDPNGLADPYVKGQLGAYRFQTKIHKKTLAPKWLEEFLIPITSWDAQNLLSLQVRDKDPIFDDLLGDCCININELRGGQRHDKWISLKNIKMGRIHIAITVNEDENLQVGSTTEEESGSPSETTKSTSYTTEDMKTGDDKTVKMKDKFEPINIEGQDKTGIWVHHPGSEVCQTWEPRKGRSTSIPETQIHKEINRESSRSSLPESRRSSSSDDESTEVGKNTKHGKIKRGLGKLGNMFHKSSSPRKNQNSEAWSQELFTTPRPNLRSVGEKRVSVNMVLEQDLKGEIKENDNKNNPDCEESRVDESIKSEGKGHLRQKAKEMVKNAGKSALRKLSDKRMDKNTEEQLLEDDYGNDSLTRYNSVSKEESKENPLVVESSPISIQNLSPSSEDKLSNKSEVLSIDV